MTELSALTVDKYCREYRKRLGFGSKDDAREFLSAKNITPAVDMAYVGQLNARIEDIIKKLDTVIHASVRCGSIEAFIHRNLKAPLAAIKDNGLLPVLNNQGRRPEQVLFSWMRGYAMAQYFTPSLVKILQVKSADISSVGDDDWRSKDTFSRTPKADFEVKVGKKRVRIEIQSGFQGINDVKQHKVIEARRLFSTEAKPTLCLHADVFNGQVALIRLDTIEEGDQHWITRQQMEGQTVFNIDQNSFCWRLTEAPATLPEFDISL